MSLPHSGSTLCGALLGAHSKSFSLGEPWKLRDYARLERDSTHKTSLGNSCTCGAPDIWQCTFWPKVNAAVEEASGLTLRDLDTASTNPEDFLRFNKLMFDAVAKVTGATLLVDSSKRVERLKMLLDANFAPVETVYLARDPRGQVLSNMKRSGRGPYRHAVRNAIDTRTMTKLAKSSDAILVAYEDIAADPAAWLQDIMPQFGLSYESHQLNWAQSERHNISGNKSRATKDNAIKVDRSWEAGLTPAHRIYIKLVAGPFHNKAGS